jgi:hypothetical protein
MGENQSNLGVPWSAQVLVCFLRRVSTAAAPLQSAEATAAKSVVVPFSRQVSTAIADATAATKAEGGKESRAAGLRAKTPTRTPE